MSLVGYPNVLPPLYNLPNSGNSTSVSSVALQVGSVTLTVQPSKSYSIGMSVKIYTPGNKYMTGDVTAYNSNTGVLTVNSIYTNSTGTFSNWYISICPPPIS